MRAYNNNNTIVKMSEFLDNPEGLITSTISRKAFLVILSEDWKEELAVFDCRNEEVIPISIKF